MRRYICSVWLHVLDELLIWRYTASGGFICSNGCYAMDMLVRDQQPCPRILINQHSSPTLRTPCFSSTPYSSHLSILPSTTTALLLANSLQNPLLHFFSMRRQHLSKPIDSTPLERAIPLARFLLVRRCAGPDKVRVGDIH